MRGSASDARRAGAIASGLPRRWSWAGWPAARPRRRPPSRRRARRAPLPRQLALMDPIAFFVDPMTYGFMQRGLAAAVLIGIVCAVMGVFVVLKGLAFIGDAVSHAAFPGLVVAYIVGAPLHIGGAIAAVATALAIGLVTRRGRLRFDTAVGVLFAGTFAFGVMLFSTIKGYVTDLLGYLLGNVLGIGVGDLVQVAILGAIVLVIVLVIRKELLFATFDPLRAAAAGLPVAGLQYPPLALLGCTLLLHSQPAA